MLYFGSTTLSSNNELFCFNGLKLPTLAIHGQWTLSYRLKSISLCEQYTETNSWDLKITAQNNYTKTNRTFFQWLIMHKNTNECGRVCTNVLIINLSKEQRWVVSSPFLQIQPPEISPTNPRTEGWFDHGVTLTEAGEQKISSACR